METLLAGCKVKENARVLIAASGSGGHLFPAQFIAKKIRSIFPVAEIAFAGSGRPLEEKLIDGAGFRRFVLPLEGLRDRSPAGLAGLLWQLPRAFWKTWRLFSLYEPDVVIGVGGYVSFFPVLIARLRGVPSWIHEAEAHAGRANRVLAYFATRISTAFRDVDIPCREKTVHTGHPLREELSDLERSPGETIESPKRILVIGGSQGAKALDEGMLTVAPFLRDRGAEVWHQCRETNVEALQKGYERGGVSARVTPFIDNMLLAYTWADVIISRTGAGAVMELGVAGKPCILVPFPFSQGGHQKVNAMLLVNQGKAILCEEGENFENKLAEALQNLFDPVIYVEMARRPVDRRSLTAAEEIAKGALALCK